MIATGCAAVNLCFGAPPDRSNETIYCMKNINDNTVILKSLQEGLSDYRSSADKLGVVLEELVKMLDLDGSGIDVYLLHYVVDARLSLRSIIGLLDSDLHT